MRKILYAFIILFFTTGNSIAQQTIPRADIRNLGLKWEIVANNYQNKPQSLSALTLTSLRKFSLPASGWKIYFSFAELITPQAVTGNVNISHINGDLFCLSPAAGFKGLLPDESISITFVSTNWVVNSTDAPAGFYLIWDKYPQKYYTLNQVYVLPPTRPEQYLRTPQDKIGLTTPQIVYEQNKTTTDIPADNLTKIFPTPYSYQLTPEQFKLDAGIGIISDPAFKTETNILKDELSDLLTYSLLNPIKRGKKFINLNKKPMDAEAYELTVTSGNISISASSGVGIFYGIQSLKSLIPWQAWQHPLKTINIPGIKVVDKPRFGYRAVMLDVARNFQTKKQILKLLNVMALYKLNVLHFHLTDDEGWRLEIPTLPELTDIGAVRGHTLDSKASLQPGLGSGPDVKNTTGTGYYSKSDFIELLRYATERHITVIPEIESPGHARAAIKAMDARYASFIKHDKQKAEQYLLHDLKDTSKYTSVQFYNDNVIDVSLPSTYRFIETVTTEIEKMYRTAGAPLKTIHYGGDEVPAGAWEHSPAVLNLMRMDASVKKTDDLWTYYYKSVDHILKAHQLYLTAWEEVGTEKKIQDGKKVSVINPDLAASNVHLEVWNNVLGWGSEDLAYKLANRGYKVILSCVTNLYFDMAANKAFDEPGYYWGGYADVDKSFQFIPFDYFKNTTTDRMGGPLNHSAFLGKEKLTEAGKANIVGLQGALWGETLKSSKQMEYMLLPKMLGLAERCWAKDPEWATEPDSLKSRTMYDEAWANFANILGKRELPRLDFYAGGFNYRMPAVGAVNLRGQVIANLQLPGFAIHYTSNGMVPTLKSPLYNAMVGARGLIKLAAFNQAGRAGKVVEVENRP